MEKPQMENLHLSKENRRPSSRIDTHVFTGITWMLVYFTLGCLDISMAIILGNFDYTNISPSFWLVLSGVMSVLISTLYPIYALTKSIYLLLLPSAFLLSFSILTTVLGAHVLIVQDRFDIFMAYFYIFVMNNIIGPVILTVFVVMLYSRIRTFPLIDQNV